MISSKFTAPTDAEIEIISKQLGRPARGVIGISARCVCGAPTVVVTSPRLEDGTPFPTFYYLTHPAATAAVSTLEADGLMAELGEQLSSDPSLRKRYLEAHESYLRDREEVGIVTEISGISAGGMPERVKCLHALVAHSLSVGPGVNPIGDIALANASWTPKVCSCRNYEFEEGIGTTQ